LRSIWSYAGLVLALIVAAVLIVPGFLDWSRYAGLIEAQAEAVTGRDVTIAGDVRISLLPSPTLTLGRTTIANAPDAEAPHMAEVDGMTAELSVGSLFRGDLNISRLSMQGPKLWLEETSEGRGNWLFQNGVPDDASDVATDEASSTTLDTLPPITIDEIEVAGGLISLRNLGIGTDVEITSIDALVGASSLSGPYRAKGQATIGGERADFLATLGEVSPDKAYPANVSLTFKEAEAAVSGIVTGRGADMRFDGALDAGASAGLAPALGALTAGQPVSLSAGIVATPGGVDLRDVEATAGAVTLSGTFSATAGPSFSVDLNAALNRVDFTGFDTAGMPLTVDTVSDALKSFIERAPAGTYRVRADDVRLPAERLSSVEIVAEAGGDTVSVSSFTATLPGEADASAQGALSVGGEGAYFSGDVELRSSKPAELVAWVNGGGVPDLLSEQPLQKLIAKAAVFLTPARVSLDKLVVDLDGGRFIGQAGTTFEARPQVDVSLDIDTIALPFEGLSIGDRVVPGRAIDLGFDGRVAVNVGSFDTGPVHVENVSLELESSGTSLVVRELLFQSTQGASATLSGESTDTTGTYQATLTAPTVASLEGLLPLPAASLQGLSSLSLSAKAQWPDEASATDTAGSAPETVGFSALGRAGDVQFETEGQFTPGARGNADAGFSVTSTFTADRWDKLVRVGAAFGGLTGDETEETETAEDVPLIAPDTPQTVTAVVEGAFGAPVAVAIQASTAGLTGSIAGKLDTASPDTTYVLDVSVDTPVAEAVARAAGYELTDISTASFKGGIAYDGEGYDLQSVAIRIEGTDGALDVDAEGRIDPAEPRPRARLNITSREVDMRLVHGLATGAYLDGEGDDADADAEGPSEEDAFWSADLLDTSWLDLADVEFAMDGSGVVVGAIQADQLALTGILNDRTLTMTDTRALVLGGEVRGAVTLAATSGLSIDASVAGTSIDAGAASEAFGFGVLGTGDASFELSLAGKGLSALALVSSLKGEGTFQIEDGTLSGLDLAALSDGLMQLERSEDFVPLADATLNAGATPYEEISGRLAVTAGVVRAPDIRLTTQAATGKSAAFADIGRTALDIETSFALNEPEGAPAANIVFAGDFSAPERTINTVELEAFASRRLLEKDIDALGGDASKELRVILDLPDTEDADSATP